MALQCIVFQRVIFAKAQTDIAGSGRNQYPQNDRNTVTAQAQAASSALMGRPSLLVLRG